MKLFDTIRSAGGGKVVDALAGEAGITAGEAEEALRALLPEVGRAIRHAEESGSGAAAVAHAMHDERYARYLEHPDALGEPAAVADGERVLGDILDQGQRGDLVSRVAAIGLDEAAVRTLLPLVSTLAMAALGTKARDPESPEIPWFGTRPRDRFDAPLLNALTALFEQEDEPAKR